MGDKKKAVRNSQAMRGRKNGKRSRKQQRKRYNSFIKLLSVMVSLLVVALVVIIVAPKRTHTVIINHPTQTRDVEIAAPPIQLEEGVQFVRVDTTKARDGEAKTQAVTDTAVAEETTIALADPEPTAENPDILPAYGTSTLEVSGESSTGFEYLPVFKQASILEPKIAITVDDCFQVNNLQTIARTAYYNGGKITIFPIGENLAKAGMAETLKTCAFQLGFEIENHTWSHSRVFRLSEYEMAKEIWDQSQALNMVLGVNYKQHFFRLMGGDGSSDQRTHNYLKQLGYKGIAEWSLSGSDASFDEIKAHLKPGAIYLFHTTDRDTEMLKQFIPYAVSQGYQLVTMNELLGFEDNEVSDYASQNMPIPQAYEEDYRTHKVGDYAYNILRMQDKLRELGLLVMDGPSTGYYGKQTAEAIQQFQEKNGLPATGEADEATQRLLLA